jgi:hypothetical protein
VGVGVGLIGRCHIEVVGLIHKFSIDGGLIHRGRGGRGVCVGGLCVWGGCVCVCVCVWGGGGWGLGVWEAGIGGGGGEK